MAFWSLRRHLTATTPLQQGVPWLNAACPPCCPMSLALMAPVLGTCLPALPDLSSWPELGDKGTSLLAWPLPCLEGLKGLEEEAQVPEVPVEHITGQGARGSHGPWAPGSSLLMGSCIFVHPFLGPRGAKGRAVTCWVPSAGHALAGLAGGGQARQELVREELLPLSTVGGEPGKAWLKPEHPPMAARAGTSAGGWGRWAQGSTWRPSSALVCASRAPLVLRVPPKGMWGCLRQGGRSGLDAFGRFGSQQR